MIKITLLPDGPILINNDRSGIALCRCGMSGKKPICDGSHCNGFEAKAGEVKFGEFVSVEMKGD